LGLEKKENLKRRALAWTSQRTDAVEGKDTRSGPGGKREFMSFRESKWAVAVRGKRGLLVTPERERGEIYFNGKGGAGVEQREKKGETRRHASSKGSLRFRGGENTEKKRKEPGPLLFHKEKKKVRGDLGPR